MAETLLKRLRFPRRQIDEIVTAVLHHMQFKDVPHMRKATLRRMVLRPTFPLELELHRLDCLGSHRSLTHYSLARAEAEAVQQIPNGLPQLISGTDLKALGMAPGPAMGALLHEIREKQLQEEIATREEALRWAKAHIPSPH
jgi:poly(A) polymerase